MKTEDDITWWQIVLVALFLAASTAIFCTGFVVTLNALESFFKNR